MFRGKRLNLSAAISVRQKAGAVSSNAQRVSMSLEARVIEDRFDVLVAVISKQKGQAVGEQLSEGRFIWGSQERVVGEEEAEPLAEGRAVHNAGIGLRIADLF